MFRSFLLCCALSGIASLQNARVFAGDETQRTLADRLRHEFELVKSIECRIECLHSQTNSRDVVLVQELRKSSNFLKRLTLDQLIYSKADADVRSYRQKWWRQGSRERAESFRIHDGFTSTRPRIVYAFDGQLYRTVRAPDASGKISASIMTVANARWESTNRTTPFTWLYAFSERPYFKIVSGAKQFKANSEKRAGVQLTKYTLENAEAGSFTFVLYFDRTGRLVEREIWYSRLPSEARDLCEIHSFAEYKQDVDQSGEVIWFPRRVVYRYMLGQLPDGRRVEGRRESFRVLDIKFNQQLSDELFTLTIPKTAHVWDGVNNMGYLKPGSPLPSAPPPEPVRRSWILSALPVGLIVVAILFIAWWRRRAARLAEASQR